MKEILHSGDYLRKIADSLFDFLIVFESDGSIVYANEEAYNDFMYESFDNVEIDALFPNMFRREGNILVGTEPMDGRMITGFAYRSNNTCFDAEIRFISDEEGQVRNVCVGKDISSRENMLRAMDKVKENTVNLTKIKDEFVANVTHELRTPVNGILGNIQDLLSKESDESKRYTMEMIEKSCADMNYLINNILDFSKLEAGKFEIEEREFSLRAMIDYVRSNHKIKIHEKGLDFFVSVAPDIPDKLIGDELRLEQILNNLLSNAAKFTSVGKIMLEVLETGRSGNKVELFFMVVDTGIGIADKDKEKLFKGFSQVDASISRQYGGTGLGLNISKQLVELMDGSISVDSTPGKGSNFSFSVWLDVAEENAGGALGDFKVDSASIAGKQFEEITADEGRQYGSQENLQEIEKRLMKLVLCVEMDTWDKAEIFADAVKQLTVGAPHDISVAALKLKMAIQKENKEKAAEAIEDLKSSIGVGLG